MSIYKMKGKASDPSLHQRIHQYNIVGRASPTSKTPNPKIYRMRLFSKNVVTAKSKFWYFMKKINKVKKSSGEILAVNEIFEKKPYTVKNYGIWLRYDSRTGTHNMYKEFRDTTQCGAISQLYADMAGRHRALASSISIIRVVPIKDSECNRPSISQLHKSKLKFPIIGRVPLIAKKKRKLFVPHRPKLFLK